MEKDAKIYIAGHNGMVGSALHRKLAESGYHNFVLRSSREVDLRDQQAVARLFDETRPDFVFIAAARVGGIHANNTYRAQFIYDNLSIYANLIHQSYIHRVTKLAFLASSSIYPKLAPQPMSEEALLTGPLEHTHEPYAIAKIAGIRMCQAYNHEYGCNFISLVPTNLYGPNDHYDLQNAHVLPSLIRKFHEARINRQPFVEVWGTGNARREFLHVDDLAEACLFLMENYDSPEIINVGSGEDLTIRHLAETISKVVGYEGGIRFNHEKPDGPPRKLMDTGRINRLGWKFRIDLEEGIRNVYQDFLEHRQQHS